MFVDALEEKFGCDTPVFTHEILSLFPQFTKAYVFRMIKSAEQDGTLSRIDSGIYYIPRETPFGPSVVTASDVAKTRYIESGGHIYGIYAGLILQNMFSFTTHVTNTPEIVTNREATRLRKVSIDGMSFIIRRSRTEITNNNADAYRILQFFTETDGLEIGREVIRSVEDYIRAKKIRRSSLLELADYFPAGTLKNMIYSGVI